MIVGIGTDLLERDRIEDLYNRYKEKFVCKILSKSELDQYAYIQDNRKINFLCSSFSAKEAFVKALGSGFRGIHPSHLSLTKDDLGKPFMCTTLDDNFKIHLSISNTSRYTQTFIVLEKWI